MADGEPVTQKQFYTTMDSNKKEILAAVEKVNGNVHGNSLKLGVVETKLDTQKLRIDAQDKRIDDQKKWNRGLAAIEGLLATVLVALGIRGD